MEVRVADLCNSELRWTFVLAETEGITGESVQQSHFPPGRILMPAANRGDLSLKNAKPGAIKV